MAKYTVTSFAEVPLAEKASVKVVAGSDEVSPVAEAVTASFKKSGAFKVTEEQADYWFVLNGMNQYAAGKPQAQVVKTANENENGGTEVLGTRQMNQASAATGVSVAVYEAKSLSPVTYLEIPIYSGDNTEKAVRTENAYSSAFAKEAVERISDAFVTQQKDIEIAIPNEADSQLRDLFKKKDYKGFTAKYSGMSVDLGRLCASLKAVEAGTADEAAKAYAENAKVKLANYHLNLLVREAQTLDPTELKKIKSEQMMVLEAAEVACLAEAVPVALARLEYKLANLGE